MAWSDAARAAALEARRRKAKAKARGSGQGVNALTGWSQRDSYTGSLTTTYAGRGKGTATKTQRRALANKIKQARKGKASFGDVLGLRKKLGLPRRTRSGF